MPMSDITNAGAIPALEMLFRFAGQRQKILSNNIANIATPDFRPSDASPAAFQKMLAGAVERRNAKTGGEQGELEWSETAEVKHEGAGTGLRVEPATPSGNILFHDRNNRDLERNMQDLVENTAVYRVSADLLKNRYDLLRTAISERV